MRNTYVTGLQKAVHVFPFKRYIWRNIGLILVPISAMMYSTKSCLPYCEHRVLDNECESWKQRHK